MPEVILQITKLTKHFGRVKAVQELDLTVSAGQVFGLLGPNGSGKTTTLGMILGVINPTSGHFTWYGKEPNYKVRQQIGAILEHPIFFPHLTATQNLRIAAEIKEVDKKRIPEVLEWVGLLDRQNDRYSGYSLGMKQRLAIASALLSDPEVLILDEPTNGLDPLGIADIRELILRIAQEGKTIILASHLLDEVQKVCTDFCVLKQGKLIHSGNVEEELARGQYFEVMAEDLQKLKSVLESEPQTILAEISDGYVRLQSTANGEQINRYLIQQGIYISALTPKKMTLENQFLNLVRQND